MKALDKLHDISKTLKSSSIEFPDKEAEIILRNALHINLVDLYRDDPGLSSGQITAIDAIVRRRCNREPLQYIIGSVEFMGLKILVGKGVLIPRPETELMAEFAVNRVKRQESRVKGEVHNSNLLTLNSIQNTQLRILDLCTGSGCLALALAKEFPDAYVYGTDVSELALGYARQNAELNNIGNVSFVCGHLFGPCTKLLTLDSKLLTFDLIISNPPYIKTADIKTLQPEIWDWEPGRALDGGVKGLDFYRAIISEAKRFLKPQGLLMLELGAGQADAVSRIFKDAGYRDIELVKDYAGIERIIYAHK